MLHSVWHYRFNTEKDDIRFLLQLNLTGKTVIDIGANKGIYSYLMSRKVGPEGKVIAFEPQPELENHLLDFKTSFNLNNLYIIKKGLSDSSGSANLFRPEPKSGGASLNMSATSKDWQSILVDITTLDSYYDNLTNIAFIKCDVEGHEYAVFKGGQHLLKRDKPCLLFECHHNEAQKYKLFSYLTGLGFDGFFAYGGKMIHFSKFEQYPYRRKNENHRNYIFLHPDFIRSPSFSVADKFFHL